MDLEKGALIFQLKGLRWKKLMLQNSKMERILQTQRICTTISEYCSRFLWVVWIIDPQQTHKTISKMIRSICSSSYLLEPRWTHPLFSLSIWGSWPRRSEMEVQKPESEFLWGILFFRRAFWKQVGSDSIRARFDQESWHWH